MHIVEYIDPKTKKGIGKYAKRFEDVDPDTGDVTLRDEIIPKKTFCVCDASGNIKSITEVNYSHAIEVEGQEHCIQLAPGEECNRISDSEMPVVPTGEKDKLKWITDNHKMGNKDVRGKRKLKKKL